MSVAYFNGFKSQVVERVDLENLEVIGTFPDWLSGDLVRIGPGKFEVGNDRYNHWFDGLGLLHKFGIKDGQVTYQNRFVGSDVYNSAIKQNRIVYSELGTDPCASMFKRFFTFFTNYTPNTNVNVAKIGQQLVAMTEGPAVIPFELKTLQSNKKAFKFDDKLSVHLMSPHPHYDSDNTKQYNYGITFAKNATYTFYETPMVAPFTRKIVAQFTLDKYHYVHSFGMTENYFIFIKQPWTLDPLKVLFRKKTMIELFEWNANEGCEIMLIDRRTNRLSHSFRTDSFFSFHYANAYEQNGQVIFDIPTYSDPSLVNNLLLKNIYEGDWGNDSRFGHLRRYTLDLRTQKAWWYLLSPEIIDLPCINYRYNAKPYRYVYGQSLNSHTPNEMGNQLVKIDVQQKQTILWHRANHYPSEPVFVAAPDAQHEDDGVILSAVLDGNTNQAYLLALDARSLTEIARANIGISTPFTFHGAFFSDRDNGQ